MFWWLPAGSKKDNVSQDKGEDDKKSPPKRNKKSAAETKTAKKKQGSKATPKKTKPKKTSEAQKQKNKEPSKKAEKKRKPKERSEEPVTVSWTDERVETLKSLWSEGKSASEIADELGDVTRNAVIGKAHRLGLSGRPSPIKKPTPKKQPAKTTAAKSDKKINKKDTAKEAASKKTKERTKKAEAKPVHSAHTKDKNKGAGESSGAVVTTAPVLRPEPKVNPDELVGLLELTERMCRWPYGDPKEGVFGFCGQECDPLIPYCKDHILMAYQSAAKKTKKATLKKETTPKVAVQEDEDDLDEEDLEDIDDIDPDEIDDIEDDEEDLDEDDAI